MQPRTSMIRVLGLAALALLAGCWWKREERAVQPPPPMRPETVAPLPMATTPRPAETGASVSPLDLSSLASEERITVRTVAPTDAKLLLQYIADSAGYALVLPPGPGRKIEVDLFEVPMSVAISHVMELGGYSLKPVSQLRIAQDTMVVYYHLPTNVDSLSVESIMRRYGVSRELAQVIVRARRP